jgi:hypothetical protein
VADGALGVYVGLGGVIHRVVTVQSGFRQVYQIDSDGHLDNDRVLCVAPCIRQLGHTNVGSVEGCHWAARWASTCRTAKASGVIILAPASNSFSLFGGGGSVVHVWFKGVRGRLRQQSLARGGERTAMPNI